MVVVAWPRAVAVFARLAARLSPHFAQDIRHAFRTRILAGRLSAAVAKVRAKTTALAAPAAKAKAKAQAKANAKPKAAPKALRLLSLSHTSLSVPASP